MSDGGVHPYVSKYNLIPPFFDRVGRVKPCSGYTKSPPVKNRMIERWMLEEGISEGPYSYAKGDIETSFNATSKYSQPQPVFEADAFGVAWQMVYHSWSCVDRSYLVSDYYEYFDMTTSPGYPFSLKYRTKLDALADSLVLNWCDYCFDNLVFNGLWTCRCKKEPKKKEKIDNKESRVITASPMDTQAPAVRLFGQQNTTIYRAARDHRIPCTVGMTKYYKGWHKLYNRLTRNGRFTHGLELDFSGFDGSCSRAEFEQVMNLRFGLFSSNLQTPELCEAIRHYYSDVVHTKIVMDTGDVVQKHTGNPSGQVNTIVDNSLINEFRWYYAWVLIMDEKYHNIDSFKTFCELITCGDDSILTVDPSIMSLFTPEKIFNVFKRMGWKPKFGLVNGWQEVHTLSYCSANFKWVSGFVVPVPNNYQKLLASLLYGGEKRSARETLARLLGIKIEAYFLTNFRSCLDHLITEIFEKYYFQLKQAPGEDELSYSELLILNRDFSAAFGLYLDQDDQAAHVPIGPVERFSDSHIIDV